MKLMLFVSKTHKLHFFIKKQGVRFRLDFSTLLSQQEVTDDGSRTVFLEGISPYETKELRETFIKNFSVRNFLPLLNKVQTHKRHAATCSDDFLFDPSACFNSSTSNLSRSMTWICSGFGTASWIMATDTNSTE